LRRAEPGAPGANGGKRFGFHRAFDTDMVVVVDDAPHGGSQSAAQRHPQGGRFLDLRLDFAAPLKYF
jgi:hypothetical protein